MARRFTASYAFVCGCCEERYPAGTMAQYAVGGVLVATECENLPDAEPEILISTTKHGEYVEGYVPSEAEQAAARKTKCTQCFLVHAPHQDGCH